MKNDSNPKLKAALDYLRLGYSVIPVRTNKKPYVRWKQYRRRLATKKEVTSWWKQWPDANVGIITGKLSKIIVIDCDSAVATSRFLESFPEARATRQVSTGRESGQHFYFRYEEGIRKHVGTILGDQIDIQSEGGFVVAPPSIHANGKQYTEINYYAVSPLPPQLLAILRNGDVTVARHKNESDIGITKTIKQGQRNARLTSLAGKLRREGLSPKVIYAALQVENSLSCDPPLPDSEDYNNCCEHRAKSHWDYSKMERLWQRQVVC